MPSGLPFLARVGELLTCGDGKPQEEPNFEKVKSSMFLSVLYLISICKKKKVILFLVYQVQGILVDEFGEQTTKQTYGAELQERFDRALIKYQMPEIPGDSLS